MQPYDTNLLQAMHWMQDKAVNIESLIRSRQAWYDTNCKLFWDGWQNNVLELRTANEFGVALWCIILGLPMGLFNLNPVNYPWAFGEQRENFKYFEGSAYTLDNPNLVGGNFQGGGASIQSLQEAIWCLQLRYASLFSDGSIKEINRMLKFIFNDGEDWDFGSGNYFYVADTSSVESPVLTEYNMEYRYGNAEKFNFSSQFIATMASKSYGVMPSLAGIKYEIVRG